MADGLVVVDDVAEVVAPAVVGLAHAHGVVRQVDVAVVAEELGHRGGGGVVLEELLKEERWYRRAERELRLEDHEKSWH